MGNSGDPLRLRYAAVLAWTLILGALVGHGCAFSELAVATCGGFLDQASTECRACSEAACCAESEACRDSEICAALYDCLESCAGDSGCRSKCAAAHPADQAAASLAQCETELCPVCAPCAGYYGLASPACDDCSRQACCPLAQHCAEDSSCRERASCENNCAAPHCQRQCEEQRPLSAEGADRLNALADCLSVACRSECELGEQFDCVGEFQWPHPLDDEVTFTGSYYVDGVPQAGMSVAACDRLDLSCESPLATGITDADGFVTLTIPVGDSGFAGFFDVSGNETTVPLIQAQTAPLYTDEGRSFDMLSFETYALAGVLLGVEPDLAKGILFAFPEDCRATRAPGIELVLEGVDVSGVTAFYFNNGLPSTSLTETVPGMGGGGWANVLPGLYTVRAIRVDTGEEVALTQLQARANTVTSTSLSPKP